MSQSLRIRSLAVLFVAIASAGALHGQCPSNCPSYTQQTNPRGVLGGMSNDANINIQLYNNGSLNWSSATGAGSQIQAADDAIDGWAAMPGSNQDYSASNYTGSGSDVSLLMTGTAANPVVIVEQQAPGSSALVNACGPAPSCVKSIASDGSETVVGAIIYVSTDVVNGNAIPGYGQPSLAQVLSHEIGVHADMGWNNCTGNLCSNSDAGEGTYNSVGPTPCDTCQAQKCGR